MISGLEKLILPVPVHPALGAFALYLAAKSDYDWQVNYGDRTDDEQQTLYNQGRTTPGAVITDAGPGQSAHNFGLAVDFQPVGADDEEAAWNEKASIVSDWNASPLSAIGTLKTDIPISSGLDRAHVQLANWVAIRNTWKVVLGIGAGVTALVIISAAFLGSR